MLEQFEPISEPRTISFAASLLVGARALVQQPASDVIVALRSPCFFLLGLSTEHALKAVLDFREIWRGIEGSIDLLNLLGLAHAEGFSTSPASEAFVRDLSPFHARHHFQQSLDTTADQLPPLETAVDLVDRLIIDSAEFVGNRNRADGVRHQ